jgi:hypothetical protein
LLFPDVINILFKGSSLPERKKVRAEIHVLTAAPENAFLVRKVFQKVKEKKNQVEQLRFFYIVVHD